MMPPDQRASFIDIPEGHLPIRARVWMSSSQFNSLPDDFKKGDGTVGIRTVCNCHDKDNLSQGLDTRTVTLADNFHLIKATVAQHGVAPSEPDVASVVPGESIYEVLLASEQHWWMFKLVNLTTNLLTPDRLEYEAGSKGSSEPTTDQEILTQIGIAVSRNFGAFPRGFPATNGQPHDFVNRHIPAGMVLSRLFRPYGNHVVCNPFGDDLVYSVAQLNFLDTAQTSQLRALANVASVGANRLQQTSGGDAGISFTPENIVPQAVRVCYPKFPKVNDEGKYREEIRPNPFSGITGPLADTIDSLFVGDHFEVTEGDKAYSAFENLDDLATERASHYYRRALIPHHEYLFAGIHPFLLGPTIRKVKFEMDFDGAYTTVLESGFYDAPREDWQDKFNLIRAPHFPEHGEPAGDLEVNPRDDGTIDIRLPDLAPIPSSPGSPSPSPSASDGIPQGDRPGDPDDCPKNQVLMPVKIFDCDGSDTGIILCTCVKDCCDPSPSASSPAGGICTVCVFGAGDEMANGIYVWNGSTDWVNDNNYRINVIEGTGFHFIRDPANNELYKSPLTTDERFCPDIGPYEQVNGISPPPQVSTDLSECVESSPSSPSSPSPECPSDCSSCTTGFVASMSGATEGNCCCDNVNSITGGSAINITKSAPPANCEYLGSVVNPNSCNAGYDLIVDCIGGKWEATLIQDSDPFCGACAACAFAAKETAKGSIPAAPCPDGPKGVYTMTWDGTGGNGCTGSFTMVIA